MRSLIVFFVAMMFAVPANAQFNLQITEIWCGNEPGTNLTADWFEITNVGDAAWVEGTDGSLYFDDDSADPGLADLMSGITMIAPGESVIYVNGAAQADIDEFLAVWGAVGAQIGLQDGSGLGQGGDAVALFIDNMGLQLIDLESYPDANANGGQSYDVDLGAFSVVGNANGAFQSVMSNDVGQFAVGSPGLLGATIPEPSTVILLGLAGLGLVIRRRR